MISPFKEPSDNEKSVSFSVQIGYVIVFCYWWMYGLFGYFSSPKNIENNLFIIVNLVIISLFFSLCLFFFLGPLKEWSYYFSFKKKHIQIIFFSTLFLLFISLPAFLKPVNGDHFFHIQHAQTYSIFFLEKASPHFDFFSSLQANIFIWFFNIFFLCGIFLFFFFLLKLDKYKALIILFTSFLFLRLGVIYFGGNPEPFPSLRFLPIILANLALPVFDFGYRLSSFFGLVFIFIFLFNFFIKKFSLQETLLLSLSIVTIPVLWHTGLLVESSIWTAVICIPILFLLVETKERNYSFYGFLIGVTVICSLMRITSIVCLFPILYYLCFDVIKMGFDKKNFFKLLLPLVCLIPLILQNFLVGNPAASYTGNSFPELGIEEKAHLFSRLKAAVDSGAYVASIKNSLGPLILFLIALPALFLYLKRFQSLFIFSLFFLILSIFVFSIDPFLWGNGRYQAEYAAPFVALAIYLVAFLIKIKFIRFYFIIFILLLNVFIFFSIPFFNKSWFGYESYFPFTKKNGQYFILSEYPIPYPKAMEYIRETSKEGMIYTPGYSYLYSILAGFSIKNTLEQKYIMETIGASIYEDTAKKIDENKKIKIILISRYLKEKESKHEQLIKIMQQKGWKVEKIIHDATYLSEVVLLVRN